MTNRPTPMSFENDVIDRLARIEETTKANYTKISDAETRLRVVEKRQWVAVGAAILLAPLLEKMGIHILPTLGS